MVTTQHDVFRANSWCKLQNRRNEKYRGLVSMELWRQNYKNKDYWIKEGHQCGLDILVSRIWRRTRQAITLNQKHLLRKGGGLAQ